MEISHLTPLEKRMEGFLEDGTPKINPGKEGLLLDYPAARHRVGATCH
jgi:hypothetical protein